MAATLNADDATAALQAIREVADCKPSDCARKRAGRLAVVLELAKKALAGVRVEEALPESVKAE